jgi:hypothetical protein
VGTHLPVPLEVREMLEGLLGREVTVNSAPPLIPGPSVPCSVGVYVDDSLRIRAVCVLDLELSARAGAALGLVSPAASQAAIDDRVLDTNLAENLEEVFNIGISLFNVAGAEHLRLHVAHIVGQPLPADVRARALTLGRRMDLTVDVVGYGPGRMSLVLIGA